jgi:hypothetical protein
MRVIVENPNHPGKTHTVDAISYEAMRKALLKALPRTSPGMTYGEMSTAVRKLLSEDIFPGGERAGWWLKCVQLDLEAKAIVVREKTRPLRWRRT